MGNWLYPRHTDTEGHRTGILLTPEAYDTLIEMAEEYFDITEFDEAMKNGEFISFESVVDELRNLD